MPRHLDSRSRADVIAVCAGRIIAERGLSGLSLRAVAAEVGLAASTLLHQFGDRERVLMVTVATLGGCRIDEIVHRSQRDGGLGFLPDDENLVDARIWLACCELGREMPGVGEVVAGLREEERLLMDVVTLRQLDEPGLDAVMAVVEGLTGAVCAPVDPLPLARARVALEAVLPASGHSPSGQPPSSQPPSVRLRSAS